MKTPKTVRIATRKSPLALWQTHHVKDALMQSHASDITVEIIPFITEGDKRLDASLANIGGKGLFIKELEMAMINNEADIAVHSIKDIPFMLPEPFTLGAICKREDPRDALVSNQYKSIDHLPKGAIVGTSSTRRTCLLKSLRPDIKIKALRGNIGTRLSKLDNGEYDAIILAAAGLIRLKETNRIQQLLPEISWIPAPGQGAVGIECRSDDQSILDMLAPLNDEETTIRVTAERAVNKTLEGSCHLPIGIHATIKNDQLHIHAMVGHPQKNITVTADISGDLSTPIQLGENLAKKLLDLGANEILRSC